MALPSVSYTFTNGTTASASQVNQNFSDIVAALTDTTKSLSIDALTTAGAVSLGTTLSVAGNVTLTTLTASRAVFTNGSSVLVSNAITGSGNVVMSASPTLTGTITAAAATFSGALTQSGGPFTFNNDNWYMQFQRSGVEFGNMGTGSNTVANDGAAATDLGIKATNNLYIGTGGTNARMKIDSTGVVKIHDLAGTGSRAVIASSTGVLSAPTPVHARGYRATSNQSIASAGTTTVVFNAESYDTATAFNTTTGVFTAPSAGKYLLIANLTFANINSGSISVDIYNGSTNLATYQESTSPTGTFSISLSTVASVAASDTLSVRVTASDGAYDVVLGEAQTFFSISKLSD